MALLETRHGPRGFVLSNEYCKGSAFKYTKMSVPKLFEKPHCETDNWCLRKETYEI